MTANYDVHYTKSCLAMLTQIKQGKKYTIRATELMRFLVLETDSVNKKVYNKYVKQFLSRLNVFGVYKTNHHSYCENLSEKMFLAQSTFHNSIRVHETSDNVTTDEVRPQTYVCRITQDNASSLQKSASKASYPFYFVDLITNENNPEIQALKGTPFYYSDRTLLILPDITYFHKEYIDEFNQLNELISNNRSEYVDQIYSFLARIHFNVFLKDDMTTYKYKNVFYFFDKNTKNAKVDELLNIKTKITEFIVNNFFNGQATLFDENLVDIMIGTDSKYGHLIITFNVYNKYYSIKYLSFIKQYNYTSLHTFIDLVQNQTSADVPNYFVEVQRDKLSSTKDCLVKQPNRSVQHPKQVDSPLTPIDSVDCFETLFEIKTEEITRFEVIHEYYRGNKHHTYCSEFFVVLINQKLFEVSIKSVTYHALNYDQQRYPTEFRDRFFQSLDTVLQGDPDVQYNGPNDEATKYYFDQLPSMVEIYVKEITNEPIHSYFKYYIPETAHEYNLKVLPKIKQVNVMNSFVILTLMLQSCRRNHYDFIAKNRNVLEQCPILGIFVLTHFSYSDHFIMFQNTTLMSSNIVYLYILIDFIRKGNRISTSKFDQLTKYIICTDYDRYKSNNVYVKTEFQHNIDDATIEPHHCKSLLNSLQTYIKANFKKHIIWYAPHELEISNDDLFVQMIYDVIHQYNQLVHDAKLNLLSDSISDIYTKITNIVEGFKSLDVPDIHANIDQSTNFYKLYLRPDFVHNIRHLYQNGKDFVQEVDQLFSKYIQVHKIQSSKETLINHYQSNSQFSVFHLHFIEDDNNIDEVHNNYVNMSETRPLLWNKVKYTDFSNKTMLVFVLLNAGEKGNREKITEYLKRSHREEIVKDISIIDLRP